MSRKALGPAGRAALREVDATAETSAAGLVRAAEGADVFSRIDAQVDTLRQSLKDAAVFVSTRPGRSHEGAVSALVDATESLGVVRRRARDARAEVDDAEWAGAR